MRRYGEAHPQLLDGVVSWLVDGNGDTTPAKCASKTHTSVDG